MPESESEVQWVLMGLVFAAIPVRLGDLAPSGVCVGMGWGVVSCWRKCAMRGSCVDEGVRELLLLAPLPPAPLLGSPRLSVPRLLDRPRFVPYDYI